MREILFRGKRIGNGEWVKGYVTRIKHSDDKGKAESYYFNALDELGWVFECAVSAETVCQYTGLTDKNGRKIFEGDILSGERYHDWGQGGEYVPDKCVIKWNEKRAAFDPVYWWEGYNHDLKHYEVIGNIFDNPELLNEEDEEWDG